MNTIAFTCDCGKTIRVDARLAGRRGRCPSCGAVVRIPAGATDVLDDSGATKAASRGVSNVSPTSSRLLPDPVVSELPERMRANRAIAGKLCTICRATIVPGEDVHNCTRCKTSYHAECWDQVGGCGTYGCENAPSAVPKSAIEVTRPVVSSPPPRLPDQNAASLKSVNVSVAMSGVAGHGCPRCGSPNIKQKRHTSGVGWGLFFGGIVASFFTCGLGLILCVIAVFLSERRGHCRACGWVWKS